MADLPTGTVTFLFTDIEGSTRLLLQQGQRYGSLLTEYRELLRSLFQTHRGQEVDTQGDSFFVVFGRAVDAIAAAVAIQRSLASHSWPAGVRMATRVGLHTGEPQLQQEGYVGLDVHRAARLMAAGHGGQVLLSQATYGLVLHELPEGVSLRDLGEHRLKDLLHPERIFQLVIPDLPADFPPLKTLESPRSNLPAQPTPLIGREREIADVAALLRRADVRLVTLTGPGGMGKTRLGLQVAAELLDDFPDGVWFVNLAPISDPELVATAITQTLGVQESGGRPLIEDLQAALREKHLLLLLDNFEQVVDAAPLVSDLLAAALDVTILATSRAVLHLRGEYEFAVPPLALPDRGNVPPLEWLTQYEAVRLFIDRAQAAKSDFTVTNENAPAVAGICHQLDGLPLAIELAAARIKLFPPEALLARLSNRLALLTGGARDLPARHQTLRNTIAWSYGLLSAEEQILFRRLGVFVGGCTLEAAEAVCGVANDLTMAAVDGVAALLDQSLLRRREGVAGEPRFTMLETVNEYALERLEESGEAESIRRQHANYFVALAEVAELHRYTPTQGLWLLRLDADHDNMRASLAWSQTAAASVDVGARLAGALQWFWPIRGYRSEGRAWLEQVLQRSSSAAGSARAKVLYGAGRLESDLWRASTLMEQALALWRDLGDKPGIADALLFLGRVVRLQGDYDRSGKLVQESLNLFREQQTMWGVVWALLSLADVALDQGDPAQALEPVQEALALTQSLGDAYGNMWARFLGGRLAHQQGDLERAALLLEESLTWLRNLGNPRRFEVLNELGRVALDQGDTDRAAALFGESLKLSWEPGNESDITFSLVGLAGVAGKLGQPAQAAHLLGAAEAIRQSIGRSLTPVERSVYDRYAATICAQLDDATFAAMWAEGHKMTLEQAIAEALGDGA